MSGAIKRQTTNFAFNIINYDFPRWHTFEWQNWDTVDAVLAAAGLTSVRGIWANSTQYIIGDRVVDDTDNTIWLCAVNHTSAASGTFAAERTANPSYWIVISSLPVNRGTWVTAVNYSTQDIVRQGNAYYFCIAAHTSGVFATDLAANKWALIFDLTDAINASTAAAASASAAAASQIAAANSATAAAGSASTASTAATNAGNSATAAGNSATAASGSASAASTSASNAATSATNAAASASAANTSASNAATSATNANNSAIAAAASAATIANDKVQPGALEFYLTTSAPAGRLKANGALADVAVYSALTTAIYCGDANNATATWGYRTNSTDTVRSTTGTHIRLPDWRGEFTRAFDDGRGVDSGRSLWASQAQAIQSHTHTVNDPGHLHAISGGISIWDVSNGTTGMTGGGTSGYTSKQADANVTGITIQSTGGTETRPRNMTALACIKY